MTNGKRWSRAFGVAGLVLIPVVVCLGLGQLRSRVSPTVERMEEDGWLIEPEPTGKEGETSSVFARLKRALWPSSSAEGGAASRDALDAAIESRLRELKQRVKRSPGDARALNDLGVLQMRTSETHPYRLIQALGDLRRAREADPRLLPARFNFALVLEELSLRRLARVEWEGYSRVAPAGSRTSQFAERERSELQKSVGEGRWGSELPALRSLALQGNRDRLVKIVEGNREAARREVEERLLPAWAELELKGERQLAAQEILIAERIGEALLTLHGDPWAGDLVSSIRRVSVDRQGAERVANSLRAYSRALLEIQGGSYGEALRWLHRSSTSLAGETVPLGYLVRLQEAFIRFQQSRYEECSALQDALLGEVKAHGYRALESILLRRRGSAAYFQGDYERAAQAQTEALALCLSLSEAECVVRSSTRLADALKMLGRLEESWEARVAALRSVGTLADPKTSRTTLGEAARSVAEIDPGSALLFAEEVAEIADEKGSAGDVAVAQRDRAALLHRVGRVDEATAALDRSLQAARKIPQREDRETSLAESLTLQADLVFLGRPERAVELVTQALALLRLGPYRSQESLLLLQRAWALESVGSLALAESDFLQAVALQESSREAILQPWNRLAFLDRSVRAYDELARFRLDHGGSADRALEAVELSRGRLILDWTRLLPADERKDWPAPATVSLSSLQHRLPPGMVVLEYRFLSGGLTVWRIERARLVCIRLPLSPDWATEKISRLRVAQEARTRRAADTARTLSSELFSRLVAPALVGRPKASRLGLVPDGPLWDLPWSALRSPQTSRYLIEDFPLILAPSLAVLVRPDGVPASLEPSALLVGSDLPGAQEEGSPRALPGVEEEIKALIRLYPKAKVLVGESATREAFLAALSRAELVHFAGHTHDVDGSPLRSSLVFHASRGQAGSELLAAADLLAEALPATRLVVLSACSAATGRPSRSEGRLNLVLPLLARGVRQVLTTQWDVRDSLGRDFSIVFHRNLRRGLAAPEALRATKLTFLRSRDRRLARPQAWAAFDLVGSL